MANVGVTEPSRSHAHSLTTNCARSFSSTIALPPGVQVRSGGRFSLSRDNLSLALNSLSASRAFHRSATSNKLFPSEKSADSVVIGYHATYPAPRTAVNERLI